MATWLPARLACLVLALAVGIGWPAPAQAHVELVSSSPARGGEVRLDLDRVTLQFAEGLLDVGNAVVVRDPDGREVSVGPVETRGSVLAAPVSLTVPGHHTLAYRVVGADGHPIAGELSFTVTGSAAQAATDRDGRRAVPVTATASSGTVAASPPVRSAAAWALPVASLTILLFLLHGGRRRRARVDED